MYDIIKVSICGGMNVEELNFEFDYSILKTYEEKYFTEYWVQTDDPILSLKRAYDKVQYCHPNDQITWQEMISKTSVIAYKEFLLTKEKVDREKIRRELAQIAFSDLSDFLDEKGRPKLTGNTSSVKELTITPTEHGNKIAIKLYDKLTALRQLLDLIPEDRKQEIPIINDDIPETLNKEVISEGSKKDSAPPPSLLSGDADG